MDIWGRVVALSVGGALGVNARYFLGLWVTRLTGQQFPWATFLINVSGSLAIGFLATLFARTMPQSNLRLLVVTGFLGGYTTYSAFAFESLTLWERGEKRISLTYILSTVVGGLLAVILGASLARSLTTLDDASNPRGNAEPTRIGEKTEAAPHDSKRIEFTANPHQR